MITSLRYFSNTKQLNRNSVSVGNTLLQRIKNYQDSQKRYKSSDDKDEMCCNALDCTKKEFPKKQKCDLANTMYRCEKEPVPPNYDPYRIKVQEIEVPPLPPSKAQELTNGNRRGHFQDTGGKLRTSTLNDLFKCCPVVHPDYWKGKVKSVKNNYCFPPAKLGYHGKTKLKFAFHEPWRPLDRVTLLAQAEREENDSNDKGQTETATQKA